ncbi:hypothetical protein Glove_58g109 [Diversispora epigaea]|uniref:Uncharacterized protein n=1 Tax=Diversispora epigaea TaxID=1348612 RepID=A0A397JFH4_9GLOM|nr:hypothetical protein Glove_58g109 [Diversispora epigaea]
MSTQMENIYCIENGTTKEEKEKFKWYLKSAEGENNNDQFILRNCYFFLELEKQKMKVVLKISRRDEYLVISIYAHKSFNFINLIVVNIARGIERFKQSGSVVLKDSNNPDQLSDNYQKSLQRKEIR